MIREISEKSTRNVSLNHLRMQEKQSRKTQLNVFPGNIPPDTPNEGVPASAIGTLLNLQPASPSNLASLLVCRCGIPPVYIF